MKFKKKYEVVSSLVCKFGPFNAPKTTFEPKRDIKK